VAPARAQTTDTENPNALSRVAQILGNLTWTGWGRHITWMFLEIWI